MRFRTKIVLLLICLSIVPIVALRAFGIYNVRLFAEEVRSQVEGNSRKSAELRFGAIMQTHRQLMAQTFQKLDMALLFQAYEARRLLFSEVLCQNGTPRASTPEHFETVSAAALANDDDRQHCILADPAAKGTPPIDGLQRLGKLAPVYQTIGDQLGTLVLRHYTAIGPWASVFPGNAAQCARAWPAAAAKDFAALEERFSYWSAPYTDPESGHAAAALTLPVTCPDETAIGWTGIVVDLERLLEATVSPSALAEGAWAFIGTIAADADGGVGIETIARLGSGPEGGLAVGERIGVGDLQVEPDEEAYRSLLHDFLRLRNTRREVVFRGRESHWAFSAIPHQGTGLVLAVPRLPQPDQEALLDTIQRRTRRVELLTLLFLGALVLAVILTAAYFSRVVTRPLESLTRAARRLAGGDLETRVTVVSRDEIGDLGVVFNEVGPQLAKAYAMRRSAELASEIQHHLLPDPLWMPWMTSRKAPAAVTI